jgi:hypothetical protein
MATSSSTEMSSQNKAIETVNDFLEGAESFQGHDQKIPQKGLGYLELTGYLRPVG